MSVTRSRGRPPYADRLTPAEWRVADAIRHGGTDRTISKRLGISSDAVKFHVGNILGKLGFANRRALRQWAGVPQASALGQRRQRGDDMSVAAQVLERDDVRWGTIGQLARSVCDIAAAEAWYRDVLRLPHLYTFGNLAFFDCGGTRLMLSAPAKGPRPTATSSISACPTFMPRIVNCSSAGRCSRRRPT